MCERKIIQSKKLLLFLIPLVAFCLHTGSAADSIFPDNNGTCINDFAKLINPQDANTIKSLCTIESIPKVKKEYENAVLYGTELSNYWGIGRDGILILISKRDRKAAICTGYLTEHYLPDSEAGRILDEYMIPQFKEGNFGTGIIAGIIEARKVMEKNRRLMYPEKYGEIK
jgi:hypothetical protein